MNWRSPKLLGLANEVPVCLSCGLYNTGNVVAAHSNKLRHGKGRALKSHDIFVAFLCYYCHQCVDTGVDPRTQQKLSIEEREEKWYLAWEKTLIWLMENDHLQIS